MNWVGAIYQAIVSFFEELSIWLENTFGTIRHWFADPNEIINKIWQYVIDQFFYAINEFVRVTAELMEGLLDNLPQIPVPDFGIIIPAQYMGWVNWLLPFDHLAASIGLYLWSTIMWLTMGIALRWLKMVG